MVPLFGSTDGVAQLLSVMESQRDLKKEPNKLSERVELFLGFKRFKVKLWGGSSPLCLLDSFTRTLLFNPFLEVPLHGSPSILSSPLAIHSYL